MPVHTPPVNPSLKHPAHLNINLNLFDHLSLLHIKELPSTALTQEEKTTGQSFPGGSYHRVSEIIPEPVSEKPPDSEKELETEYVH